MQAFIEEKVTKILCDLHTYGKEKELKLDDESPNLMPDDMQHIREGFECLFKTLHKSNEPPIVVAKITQEVVSEYGTLPGDDKELREQVSRTFDMIMLSYMGLNTSSIAQNDAVMNVGGAVQYIVRDIYSVLSNLEDIAKKNTVEQIGYEMMTRHFDMLMKAIVRAKMQNIPARQIEGLIKSATMIFDEEEEFPSRQHVEVTVALYSKLVYAAECAGAFKEEV